MNENLHPWVRVVDQAGRPLPPKALNILVGLTLKLVSLCSQVTINKLKSPGRFCLFFINI